MCGRFTLRAAPSDIAQHFGLDEIPDDLFEERDNIAPSQTVATVRLDDAGHRTLGMNRWGLIPAWSKDAKIGFNLTNARAETIAKKPAFRSTFKSRRCVIPADGCYEWVRRDVVTVIVWRSTTRPAVPSAVLYEVRIPATGCEKALGQRIPRSKDRCSGREARAVLPALSGSGPEWAVWSAHANPLRRRQG
jgi:putative SOS response-associated peptidase YedK